MGSVNPNCSKAAFRSICTKEAGLILMSFELVALAHGFNSLLLYMLTRQLLNSMKMRHCRQLRGCGGYRTSCLGPVAGVLVGQAMQLVEEEAMCLGAGMAERHARRRLLRLAAHPATDAEQCSGLKRTMVRSAAPRCFAGVGRSEVDHMAAH